MSINVKNQLRISENPTLYLEAILKSQSSEFLLHFIYSKLTAKNYQFRHNKTFKSSDIIFISCISDRAKMSAFGGNNGNFGDSKRVKTDIPEEEQPSLIINQVRENLESLETIKFY